MNHIIVDQINLKSAIDRAGRVTDNRGSIPALQSICFSAENGELSIKASNLDAWITITTKEETDNMVTFLVDGKKINEIIARFPLGCQIKIEHDEPEQRIKLSTKGKRFNIGCLPSNDFPNQGPMPEDCTRFNLDAQQLKKAINIVNVAVCRDEVRYYLNGIFWHPVDGNLQLVALDGSKVCIYKIRDFEHEFEGVIMPDKAIQTVQKLIDKLDEVEISITERFIQFSASDFIFRTKLIEGNYPDYPRVTPKNVGLELKLNITDLETAVRDVMAAAPELKDKAVKLNFEDGQIIATNTTSNAMLGECSSVIDNNYIAPEDEILTVGFCGNYLLDFINILNQEYGKSDKDTMKLVSTGSLSPMRITHEKQKNEHEDNTIFVLMPMRV